MFTVAPPGVFEVDPMQPYEPVILRKVLKRDPALLSTHNEALSKLKKELIANPPGPGTLRKLKKQAERDVLADTFRSLASNPEAGRRYDLAYARAKGVTTRD